MEWPISWNDVKNRIDSLESSGKCAFAITERLLDGTSDHNLQLFISGAPSVDSYSKTVTINDPDMSMFNDVTTAIDSGKTIALVIDAGDGQILNADATNYVHWNVDNRVMVVLSTTISMYFVSFYSRSLQIVANFSDGVWTINLLGNTIA